MDLHDDEMLFEAELLQGSSQESLTNAARSLWRLTDESQDIAPAAPPTTSINASTGAASSEWHQEGQRTDLPGPSQPNSLASTPHGIRPQGLVMSRIESIFESMIDVLLQSEGSLSLILKVRAQHQTASSASSREIRFPGRTAQEAWRFTVLVRILELIHEALVTNCIVSKREIYYRHPALFVKQSVVDRYVDDIAFTFGVSRFALNVTAAAKGLVIGALTMHKADSLETQTFLEPEGHLIPKIDEADSINMTPVQWILVVEKEATFRSIAASSLWNVLKHQGVMITGKGYPDLSTRSFLRALSESSASDPHRFPTVYALVDFDPDGMNILSIYKYGSARLAHESAALNVPGICWLGVKSSDIILADDEDTCGIVPNHVHRDEGLLRLSARDRRKATNMLSSEYFAEGVEQEWRRELQVMLTLNMKAEIQILEARKDGLADWLKDRLHIPA